MKSGGKRIHTYIYATLGHNISIFKEARSAAFWGNQPLWLFFNRYSVPYIDPIFSYFANFHCNIQNVPDKT